MLSTIKPRAEQSSARDIAQRATDAAMRAADAAIRAADAAITAADAAVRLIDEHSGEVIMLEPAAARARENRSDSDAALSWPPIGLAAPGASKPNPSPRPSSRPVLARARSRFGLRALPVLLIVLGTLVLIDAAVTFVWQEPFSALYAKLRQDHLSGSLQRAERAAPTPAERRALASLPIADTRVEFLARELEHRAPDGGAVARIVIPRIGASDVVVKGTSTADLESGPGIYPQTVFPGMPGTTAIAGHRTTYLAPFRHIDALRPGNPIRLNTPYAHFTYTVIGSRVVAPTDVRAAVADVGYPRLVLSACTPLFSAAKRLLVYARLTGTVPVGAARAPAAAAPAGIAGEVVRAPLGEARLPAMLEAVQPHLPPRV